MNAPLIWVLIWYGAALTSWLFRPEMSFRLENALTPGFDAFGRSLLFLSLEASLRSTLFSLVAVGASVGVALTLASLTPLISGGWRWLLESPVEFLVAFPSLLFALGLGAWFGPGQATVLGALTLGLIPSLTRFLLARSRELESREFMLAARALGASRFHIMFHHFFPHLYPLVSVKIPALLVQALIAEASLSFLGLGFSSGTESWGTLLAQGKDYLIEAPSISLLVGVPLLLSVWAFDAISKRLEPELR
jgi:ABC-type dipeptide/oligopeptide/nickel transport system permease subunit